MAKVADASFISSGGGTTGRSLNSYPTMVESPFVMVEIYGFTFGNVSKSSGASGNITIDYPNFIKNLSVKKVNGDINQYTITLVYAIQPGDDPNFVDKLFSKVGYGSIKISYGDFSYPSLIYKNEEALITDLKQDINFVNATITYTISATGTTFTLKSEKYNFPAVVAKPSTVIKELLANSKYKLQSAFTGMYSLSDINQNNWIASSDAEVLLQAQAQIDCWEYIQYCVSCMKSESGATSTYALAVNSDNKNKNGTYFEVKEISKQGSTHQELAFDIDIGYPGSNYVSSFSVNTNQGWSILMQNANNATYQTKYQYSIDANGNLQQEYSPSLIRSNQLYKRTAEADRWWSDMTNFPIEAVITLKGLVAPTILLAYVNLNVVFYGQQHNTSGMYFITEQTDSIGMNGYKTTLKLQRVPKES